MAAPPISVLLPARNARDTLGAALDSVLAQTWGDLEVVVVDDGSSDGTGDVARARRDPRVRVLRREGPGDIVDALERGRRACRGAWICRMDADDVSHPRRLEWTRPHLRDARLGVVSGLVRSFPTLHVHGGRARYDAWLNGLRRHEDMARERFVESPLAHPAVVFRAAAVEAVGGYRRLRGPEDYDLWLRLFAAGWRFVKVPKVVLFWREGEERLSRVDRRYDRRGFTEVRAEALTHTLGGRPAAIVGSGAAGKRLARALLARGVEVTRFLDVDPRKVGRAPLGVPVQAHAEALAGPRGDELWVSAVNAWGGRARVRSLLCAAGLREGSDFVLAA